VEEPIHWGSSSRFSIGILANILLVVVPDKLDGEAFVIRAVHKSRVCVHSSERVYMCCL
jgi:hypothetical protein